MLEAAAFFGSADFPLCFLAVAAPPFLVLVKPSEALVAGGFAAEDLALGAMLTGARRRVIKAVEPEAEAASACVVQGSSREVESRQIHREEGRAAFSHRARLFDTHVAAD